LAPRYPIYLHIQGFSRYDDVLVCSSASGHSVAGPAILAVG
jgi:hypothetical protein